MVMGPRNFIIRVESLVVWGLGAAAEPAVRIQRLSYSVSAHRQKTGIDYRRLPVLFMFHHTVLKQILGTYRLATHFCLLILV
jgi:hypothetical protein